MIKKRVKITNIIENQLPDFMREDSPLLIDFLRQYYISLESTGGTLDIFQNIDQYVKLDNLTNLVSNTILTEELSLFNNVINVESTVGFPNNYGLIKINDEIISYESKTEESFINCHRGFSGIESYGKSNFEKELIFTKTNASEHNITSNVENLNILFLKEFLLKIKTQFIPGFENRKLTDNLNENIFIKQAKDFYSSKGTTKSFDILFAAIYGERVKVIKPRDFLLKPSDSNYLTTQDIVVEPIIGNPEELINQSLFQDEDEYFSKASGTISNIEKTIKFNREYYILSIDYDYNRDIDTRGTITGQFSIHPKTKIIGNVNQNQTYLDVDSTVGFPNSGVLIANVGGIEFFISYKSKTLTQFFECENVPSIQDKTSIRLNSYAYGFSNNSDNQIKVRIGGVLSNLNILDDTFLSDVGDTIRTISPGKISNDIRTKNWLYNISISYDLVSPPISGIVNTFDEHNFTLGDSVIIESSDGLGPYEANVITINNKKSIVINPQVPINSLAKYKIKRKLLKLNFRNYPELSNINSNIQNVYLDRSNNVYVTTPSIPNYLNNILDINDFGVKLNGPQKNSILNINNHQFLTGDNIYYSYGSNSLDIPEGPYFVKKISDNTIKLAQSREKLFIGEYVSFNSESIINDEITFLSNYNKRLSDQKLIRKIPNPEISYEDEITKPGRTGVFLNGVELLNYKSEDFIYFGEISEINILSTLDTYDVINPPEIDITDSTGFGFGAEAILHIEGNLKRVNIEDSGFDYIEEPKVTIFGGNGDGAVVSTNLVSFEHTLQFNSQNNNVVDLNNNIITFSQEHKFRNIEKIIYNTENKLPIGGLVNKSLYYIKSIDQTKIKLYNTIENAVTGIGTINLSSLGEGVHSISSLEKKKKIGSITVLNSGKNYRNKLVKISESSVNVKRSTITAKNHGFLDKDVVEYRASDDEIGGLTRNKNYYVKVINKDEFSLININDDPNLPQDLDYINNNIIQFTSRGTVLHFFNYPQIQLNISGITGVNDYSKNSSIAKLNPIFRGKISNIFLVLPGSNYGNPEIINYQRQPIVKLIQGSEAAVKPIIFNGSIKGISILNSGKNYKSSPDIEVIGQGRGAVLTPILNNGKIVDIKIINGGFGYEKNNTVIIIKNEERESSFNVKLQSWNVNNYYRFLRSGLEKENEALLVPSLNEDYGLQYAHLAIPNSLRKILLTSKFFDDDLITISDKDNDSRSDSSKIHSPIIGWAYDGNPIYGPYGFSNPDGGSIRLMKSSYVLNLNSNRPSFPAGFFVEDYTCDFSGDLDEFNGRFCVTPEFPNGIYAYFCTLDFEFNPIFPFVIGNKYKSKVIPFNLDKNSNQDKIDLAKLNLLRNTEPYKFLSTKSAYDYIDNPNKEEPQISKVFSIKSGTLDYVDVNFPGIDYKVGEKIIFDSSTGDFGFGCSAEISEINGKEVEEISVTYNIVENVNLVASTRISNTIGISSLPHNLKNGDIINIFDPNKKDIFNDFYKINVFNNELVLRDEVKNSFQTGIITYFNVNGNLDYPYIISDDIYQINSEKVKILSVDKKNRRVKVLREYDLTSSTEYTPNTRLIENSRKFYTNLFLSDNYTLNKKIYFDPSETVGVGIGTTVVFSNPGIGITQIFIPEKQLYLPDHELSSGERLLYDFGSGSSINFSENVNSIFYVIKISKDFIGLATTRYEDELITYNSFGIGENHSFSTINDDALVTKISNINSKVKTKEDHLLKINDKINLTLKTFEERTYILKYDLNSRNVIIDQKQIENIDYDQNIITINDHSFKNGQKIIINSTPVNLNVDGNKYYINLIDKDKFKLSQTYYNAVNKINSINLSNFNTQSFLSLVNPELIFYANETVTFDLSDPSLDQFDFNLYLDSKYKNIFYGNFNVEKIGIVGTENAKLTLTVNEVTPRKLYYSLSLKSKKNILVEKSEYFNDNNNILNNNSISIVHSGYSGKHLVTGIGSGYFNYNLTQIPEKNIYINNINSIITYSTTSKNSFGGIHKIKINSGGRNYKKLPAIKKIETEFGSKSILTPKTNSIGKISKVNIDKIGFDYFSDKTLSPSAKIPEILKVNPLTSIDKIEVIFQGEQYNISPNLVMIDGFTEKVVDDILLEYNIKSNTVVIIKNTTGIYNTKPTIIPTNNSNGIRISQIEKNISENKIIIFLDSEYSDILDFPFSIGDNVLVENVNIIENSGSNGYNSSEYNFKLFKLSEIYPQIGGENPHIVINLNNFPVFINDVGTFDVLNSSGIVVPEKFFPVFDIKLKKNKFFIGEEVISDNSTGFVEFWDEENELLKINTTEDFNLNNVIIGKSSGSKGEIIEKYQFNSTYDIDSSSSTIKSWQNNTGFLNDDFQRMSDNYYYQNFSYSLNSKVQINDWENLVSSLNHTSGFKKFSDLEIESIDNNYVGINTDQNSGRFDSSSSLVSNIDLDCKNDYDLVSENSINIDSKLISDKIIFESKELIDYFNCKGNRVLSVDDISTLFRNTQRLNLVNRFRI